MKSIFFYYIIALLCSVNTNAQITETVTLGNGASTSRTFVIEDDLRVRNLEDKTNDPNYSHVLIPDSNGNIYKTPKNEFILTVDNNDNKLFYLTPQPLIGKVEVEDFVFSFEKSTNGGFVNVKMHLNQQPAANLNVFYTLFYKYNTYNFVWSAPNTYPTTTETLNLKQYTDSNLSFTTSNWNVGQNIISKLNIGDFSELWLSYPEKAIIYRVVCYVRQNSGVASYNMQKNFTILVEKFDNN